jgi:clan AA aspartic protease (TIGR02281 family)
MCDTKLQCSIWSGKGTQMQPQTLLAAGLGAFVMMVVGLDPGQLLPAIPSVFAHATASEADASTQHADSIAFKSDKTGSDKVVRVQMEGGHFPVLAWIGNMQVTGIIDSGASGVAINRADAQRLGGRFTLLGEVKATFADGNVVQCPVGVISEIRIGPIVLRDVGGAIVPGNNVTLIGLTFLTRLKRFSIENYVATLEQ